MSTGFRLASRNTYERRTGKKLSWSGANGQQTVLNELHFQAGGSFDPLSFHNPATEKYLN